MKTKQKTKQKTKFLDLNDYKNSRWWINSGEKITWYTKRGDDIWLIPGSEFPEKKIDMKTGKISKIRSNSSELRMMLVIMISSFVGVTIAILLASILL